MSAEIHEYHDTYSINVLDKGYVKLVDFMGDDGDIANAARVSKPGAKKKSTDDKLIKYLYEHDHLTPFEHVVLKFRVKCPLAIARQWMRHRTFSYNEQSARYGEVTEEFYFPARENICAQSTTSKQSAGLPLNNLDAEFADTCIRVATAESYKHYRHLIDGGVARETARIVLPVNMYTEFYATGNLRNWMHFLELRNAPNAQWEIQQYAQAIETITTEIFPLAMKEYHERSNA